MCSLTELVQWVPRQGGSRTSTHRAGQSSAQLHWALWWQCQAGQPLGLTAHHCSHQGFPNSLADLQLSWALLLWKQPVRRTQGFPWALLVPEAAALPWHWPWHYSLCIHTLLSQINQLLQLTPLGCCTEQESYLLFFCFFVKSSINVVLPGVPSCSITDSSLPCELPLYVYATSKF